MSDEPEALRRWYGVVESENLALLDELLADEVVFRSPAVFAPQEGKELTAGYLSAALKVLGLSLRHASQWHDHASAVRDFEPDLVAAYVQSVHILPSNARHNPVSLPLLLRPTPEPHK